MTIRKILEDLEFDTFVTLLIGGECKIQGDALSLSLFLDRDTLVRQWDILSVTYGEVTTIKARK